MKLNAMKSATDKPAWDDLRRFSRYFRPYWLRCLAGISLTSALGLFDGAIAWLMAPYMDSIILKSGSDASMFIPSWFFPVLIIIFAVVQSVVNYGANYLTAWVSAKVGNDLRLDLFGIMTRMDSGFFDRFTTGEAQVRFSGDAQTATTSLLAIVRNLLTMSVKSAALIGVMLWQSWILTLVSVGMIMLVVVPLNRVRRRLKGYIQKSVESGATLATGFNEAYLGNRVVSSYNLYPFVKERMRAELATFLHLSIKMVQKSNLVTVAMHSATAIGLAATIWLQEYLIRMDHITPGNLVSFLTALLMFYTPLKKIGNDLSGFLTMTQAIGRVLSVVDLRSAIVNKPGALPFSGISKGIGYNNVSFHYTEGKTVLDGIRLAIPPGTTVAFVGNSGGGKTSLVNLLPRFYDVTAGSVTIDGVDVRDIDLDSLRDNIAVVFQDNFLFGGTIRDNILLGKPGATQDEVGAAVKAACLEEFVHELEFGLETEIGERGVTLSGGQKQRVAIARAFIKDAPIVILDEATSALDNKSEHVVQEAIENLMRNKTVLIIAHRLSTIINADKIVVVQEGRLAEMGTHEELLARDGVYASLYKMFGREAQAAAGQ